MPTTTAAPAVDAEAFRSVVSTLLDWTGVPASGLVIAARPLPPAEHLVDFETFRALPAETIAAARDFAESERRLFEQACRHLAENRGVRALQFLHGGGHGR